MKIRVLIVISVTLTVNMNNYCRSHQERNEKQSLNGHRDSTMNDTIHEIMADHNAPTKRALIVAVSKYKDALIPDISSTNDIPLIESILLSQNFKAEDITIVKDEQATKKGIVNAFENLIAQSQKGDIVLFHFSGHGQQVLDKLSKQQDEVDGFDEALVPYDASSFYMKGKYEGENHLIDDELGQLLFSLRQKIGNTGDIIVTIDACHSGTATRGLGKSRGINMKIAPEDSRVLNSADEGVGLYETAKMQQENLAPIVVISASGQDEVNYEYADKNYQSYGSLSYALSSVLLDMKKNITYAAAFEKVKIRMSQIVPRQTPQIEGDINRTIFGGENIESKPYVIIKKFISEKEVKLDMGQLQGIYDKSIIEFYPIGTYNTNSEKSITRGTVAHASLLECDLVLDNPITKEQSENIWGFIILKNYGDISVNVQISSNYKKYENELVQKLNAISIIEIVDLNPDLLIELKKKGPNLMCTILTKDEKVIFNRNTTTDKIDKTIDEIEEYIKKYSRSNLFRKIEMTDGSINVKFDFIPAIPTKGNQIVFKHTDEFKLCITNHGEDDAYFTIIDIMPNNDIQVLIPPEGTNARDFKIKAFQTDTLDYTLGFDPIYGKEMFTLIATKTPLNLDLIVNTRGMQTRGANNQSISISNKQVDTLNPLELLYYEGYTQTRAKITSVPPKSANIFSRVFEVIE